jgi:hypothetical protein
MKFAVMRKIKDKYFSLEKENCRYEKKIKLEGIQRSFLGLKLCNLIASPRRLVMEKKGEEDLVCVIN